MKPIAIPDHLVPKGGEKRTIKGGDTGAEDVEAIIVPYAFEVPGKGVAEVPTFIMLIQCDEQDLADLAEDGKFLLTFYGDRLHPFATQTLLGALR